MYSWFSYSIITFRRTVSGDSRRYATTDAHCGRHWLCAWRGGAVHHRSPGCFCQFAGPHSVVSGKTSSKFLQPIVDVSSGDPHCVHPQLFGPRRSQTQSGPLNLRRPLLQRPLSLQANATLHLNFSHSPYGQREVRQRKLYIKLRLSRRYYFGLIDIVGQCVLVPTYRVFQNKCNF